MEGFAFSVSLDLLRQGVKSEEGVWVVVRGGSMGPSWEGVRVRLRSARWVWPGDLVVFLDGAGNLVLHRWLGAVWWPGRGILHWTQGDFAPQADGWFGSDRLIARVVEVEEARKLVASWPVRFSDRVRAVWRGFTALWACLAR
jgi:hypothetical protein